MNKNFLRTGIVLILGMFFAASGPAQDNLRILMAPSDRYGIFREGETISVWLEPCREFTSPVFSAMLKSVDSYKIWEKPGKFTQKSERIDLPELSIGWYKLSVTNESKTIAERIFIVIPATTVSENSPIGIMNPYRLDLSRKLGANWLRLPLDWHKIESEKGKFDWSCEKQIAEAQKQGMKLIGMIAFCPRWASSEPDRKRFMIYPPRDPREYGDFVFNAVSKYKDRIKYWEIWNEPDVPQFWAGTPEQFGEVLKAGYLAAKKADPTCQVIFGGLSWADTRLFETVLKAGYGKYFDIMADHPYSNSAWVYALKQDSAYRAHLAKNNAVFPYYSTLSRADNIRSLLKKYASEKPLWATELGATTGQFWPFIAPTRLSHQEQSWHIFKSVVEAFAAGYRNIILYQFTCKKEPDDIENFGIFEHDLVPRPSAVTYAVLVDRLQHLKHAEKLLPKPVAGINGDATPMNIFSLELNDGTIFYAAWCNDAQGTEAAFQTTGDRLLLTDAGGTATQVKCPEGHGKLNLTPRPCFILSSDRKKIVFSIPEK